MGAATGYSAHIKIEGPAVKNGQESLTVGSGGCNVATGGLGAVLAKFIPFKMDVWENKEIQIFGEMCGTDMGQCSFAVGIVFKK